MDGPLRRRCCIFLDFPTQLTLSIVEPNYGRGKFHVRAAASFDSGMDHVINLLSNHRIKMKIMTEETMAAGFASSFADHAGFVAQIRLGFHCLNPA
ncbi:MAG: hypothetical protein P8Q92_08460 [Pseudoprimorskyibacter sp.]|nr:hypothetical protein [Pseudoprimorskyibacter sp.]